MSNETNIEELERLAKAATPGPWKACGTVEQIGGDCKDIIPTSVSCTAYCYGGSADRAEDKDLIFIAAANPFAVLSLIDRVKKAESDRDALAARLEMDPDHGIPDGIDCRNATIEMQDAQISALAAKLKELEGQEPFDASNEKLRVAFEVALDASNWPKDRKGHGYRSPMTQMAWGVAFSTVNLLSLFARPVPAEPVNARLVEALKRAKNSIVAFKFVPGGANCWEASDEENLTAVNSAIAAAEAAHTEPVNVDFGKRGENMFFKIDNQSFLLEYKPEEQDEFDFMKAMLLSAFSRITHGVKTEIQPVNTRLLTALKACRNKLAHDASMVAMADVAIMAAEAAPRVARLTEADVDICFGGSDGTRISAARAIETAALRKNGLALED